MVNLTSWNCLGLSGWRPAARAILKRTQAPKEEHSPLPSASLRSSALLSEADLGAAGKGGEWPQSQSREQRVGGELSDRGY